MARILFLEVDREVRTLLQDTLEKHGYHVQSQEGTPGLKLSYGPEPATSFVLSLDGEISCRPAGPATNATARTRSLFLNSLLRAFSTWPT